MQKRVLAVEDISCVGKCSLTVALPILSAAGLETSVLPTAVLSTHTGGFTGYTFRDLTDDILPIAEHWKSLGLRVDAIYTGYLGSMRQIDLVKELIAMFRRPETVVLCDPAMADNGVMYSGFSAAFAAGMAGLCREGDIVMPNITEASVMLGKPYAASGYDRPYIEDLLRSLSAMGPRIAVITGVSFEENKLGAAAYDAASGSFSWYFGDRVEGYFHGTGDIFASVFLAAYMNGKTPEESLGTAVRFTGDSIRRTRDAGTDRKYGVDFEHSLPLLMRELNG